jgi:hypothetical protein
LRWTRVAGLVGVREGGRGCRRRRGVEEKFLGGRRVVGLLRRLRQRRGGGRLVGGEGEMWAGVEWGRREGSWCGIRLLVVGRGSQEGRRRIVVVLAGRI